MRKQSVWFDAVPDSRTYEALQGDATSDIVIIGGGIVGVVAAWHCRKLGLTVSLVEKNHIGTGDTGLTTGFLTRVPDTSLVELKDTHGEDFVHKLYKASGDAQKELFDLISSESIDCDFIKAKSYYGAYEAGSKELAEEFIPLDDADPYAELIQSQAPFAEAIEFEGEGRFHSRKFLLGLLKKMRGEGFSVFEESEVESIHIEEGVLIKTSDGSIKAKKLINTTGLPPEYFSELQPLFRQKITYVTAAKFLKQPLPFNLYWDTGDPYFYFRLIDETTMIVGGSDHDVGKAKGNEIDLIKNFIKKTFGDQHEITHEWSGSLFETKDGLPYIFEHPHHKGRAYIACGFGGNGLVFGFLAGKLLSLLVSDSEAPNKDLFLPLRTGEKIGEPKKISRETGQKSFVKVAKASDVVEGKPFGVEAGGMKLALFRIGENVYAFNNSCSHAGGSLCDGEIEGKIVTCPLHAAQFDVTTGSVEGPPAVRPQTMYQARIQGEDIEVEVPAGEEPKPGLSKIKPRRMTHWASLFKFALGAFGFFVFEFALQYFWLTKGELGGSLVRSFALSGATLIGAALLSSVVFRIFPKTARLWRQRRYLGVSGFVFALFHALSVYYYFFNWEIQYVYYSLNPIENPIVFGSIALSIFMVLALTSTDWAVQKLTPRVWKFIHRFVYVGFLASVFHFITINPELLQNPPGYLLLLITILAIIGHLYLFIKTIMKKGFNTIGALVGTVIIVGAVIVGYLVYRDTFAPVPAKEMGEASEGMDLEDSVKEMKEFMEKNPPDADVMTKPVLEDQGFEGTMSRSGTFQNVNYMTSGGATLEKRGDGHFVVFGDDFETPNGPDLQIYLTKNLTTTNRGDIKDGIILGKLKSTKGKQVYKIPSGTNIEEFNSVSIHCRAFNVPWSYAPLR
ncbi:MAG: DM13 domain-containing protein [bacterium]|nr:DM13 domain-containing protein [bacterium]